MLFNARLMATIGIPLYFKRNCVKFKLDSHECICMQLCTVGVRTYSTVGKTEEVCGWV